MKAISCFLVYVAMVAVGYFILFSISRTFVPPLRDVPVLQLDVVE